MPISILWKKNLTCDWTSDWTRISNVRGLLTAPVLTEQSSSKQINVSTSEYSTRTTSAIFVANIRSHVIACCWFRYYQRIYSLILQIRMKDGFPTKYSTKIEPVRHQFTNVFRENSDSEYTQMPIFSKIWAPSVQGF